MPRTSKLVSYSSNIWQYPIVSRSHIYAATKPELSTAIISLFFAVYLGYTGSFSRSVYLTAVHITNVRLAIQVYRHPVLRTTLTLSRMFICGMSEQNAGPGRAVLGTV